MLSFDVGNNIGCITYEIFFFKKEQEFMYLKSQNTKYDEVTQGITAANVLHRASYI